MIWCEKVQKIINAFDSNEIYETGYDSHTQTHKCPPPLILEHEIIKFMDIVSLN